MPNFGGPGTVEAYETNDPTVIEPGTFPTPKIVGGFDFVGEDYDVIDDNPANDIPDPDPDPLDVDGPRKPHRRNLLRQRRARDPSARASRRRRRSSPSGCGTWGTPRPTSSSPGYEFAMDPNQDGSSRDAVDVLSFSGGVDFGPPSSVEAQAAQAVVDGGTVFVASAGNSGQPAARGPRVHPRDARERSRRDRRRGLDRSVRRQRADGERPAGHHARGRRADRAPGLERRPGRRHHGGRGRRTRSRPAGRPGRRTGRVGPPAVRHDASRDAVRRADRARLQGRNRRRRLRREREGVPRAGGRRDRGDLCGAGSAASRSASGRDCSSIRSRSPR